MNCGDVRGRLDPYLDGELHMEENVEVVRHIESCAPCAAVVEGERLFFDEVRRQAAGPPAPAGLRSRIAAGMTGAKTASRPWPFMRALVPAAAAAVLVAFFVTFFTQPVQAYTIANRAVAWHEGKPAQLVSLSSAPDITRYYETNGRKACIHERIVCEGMKYIYKSACVDASGPAGTPTCWWVAECPATGKRMTHACFKAPPELERSWTPGKRWIGEVGNRVVHMNVRRGEVCLFVLENATELERFKSVLAPPRD